MSNLKIDHIAPGFRLKDKDEKTHSLDEFKNDFVIIYFYPKDNTPGCTTESLMFDRDLEKYKE